MFGEFGEQDLRQMKRRDLVTLNKFYGIPVSGKEPVETLIKNVLDYNKNMGTSEIEQGIPKYSVRLQRIMSQRKEEL